MGKVRVDDKKEAQGQKGQQAAVVASYRAQCDSEQGPGTPHTHSSSSQRQDVFLP